MTQEKQQLMDCPFCGGKDITMHATLSKKSYWAKCEGCGCECFTQHTEILAIKAWNTRAKPLPDIQPYFTEKEIVKIALDEYDKAVKANVGIKLAESWEYKGVIHVAKSLFNLLKPRPATLPDNKEVGELVEALEYCLNTFNEALKQANTFKLVEDMKPERYRDYPAIMTVNAKLPMIMAHIDRINKALTSQPPAISDDVVEKDLMQNIERLKNPSKKFIDSFPSLLKCSVIKNRPNPNLLIEKVALGLATHAQEVEAKMFGKPIDTATFKANCQHIAYMYKDAAKAAIAAMEGK